jgi:hypothetical protein
MQINNCSDDIKQTILNNYILSINFIINNITATINNNQTKIFCNGFTKKISYKNRNFNKNIRLVMNGSCDKYIHIITSINIDYYEEHNLIEKYLNNADYHECIDYNNFCNWYNLMIEKNFINEKGDFYSDKIETFCNNCNYNENIIKNTFTPILSKNNILNNFMMKQKNILNKYISFDFFCKHPNEPLQSKCLITINFNLSYIKNNLINVNYLPI